MGCCTIKQGIRKEAGKRQQSKKKARNKKAMRSANKETRRIKRKAKYKMDTTN